MSNVWKKCSDERPDFDQFVLVRCRDATYYVAHFDGYDWEDRPIWIVDGPMGARRRLHRVVEWWRELDAPEEENYAPNTIHW